MWGVHVSLLPPHCVWLPGSHLATLVVPPVVLAVPVSLDTIQSLPLRSLVSPGDLSTS